MLKLKKFPDIPVSTTEEARGSGHRHRSSVSASKLEMRDPSLLPWERNPDVSDASQEEARCTGKARGTHGSCHHSKSPPDVSVHSRGSCFPCTASTFMPRIDSHHGGTCDNPVGKPCGKASRESHISLKARDGKRDTAATAREESARACPYSRRELTPLVRLQKYPKMHVSPGEESSGSGPDSTQGLRPWHRRERNSDRTSSNSHGDWPFLR